MTENKRAKTDREKGIENEKTIMLWAYRHGFISEEIIQNLLNVKRKPGHEWVKRSILKKIANTEERRPAYILHPSAVNEAADLYEEWRGGEADAMPYRFGKSNVPFKSHFRHAEKSQIVAIRLLREAGERMDSLSYLPEIEFLHRNPGSTAVPDFSFVRYNPEADQEQIEWHEIEITGKRNEALYYQLQTRNDAILDGRANKIIWHISQKKVKDRIEAVLSRETVPTIEKINYRFVRSPILEGWSPAKLLEATEFKLIP